MKITLLGTGTSTGVPLIGCKCEVCSSMDSRDKRLRCSALLETMDARILIDCGPDFRAQMLRAHFDRLDAVLITHEHYDHVGGIDDLRPFCEFGDIDVYAEDFCATHLEERLPYCFAEHKYPGIPNINLIRIKPHLPIVVNTTKILPIRVMHGPLPIVGFRIENMAYIIDMKTIEEEELTYLEGVEILIVNGLRHKPHTSHQTIEEAVAFAHKIGAKQTFLTHLGHQAGLHAEASRFLPPDVTFGSDGQVIWA
ncbi:MAG: MBL fold metallo-hydrolase [Bacteroidaceae bacterium]